ncbi:hypothetical protein [Faecalimonas sp.]
MMNLTFGEQVKIVLSRNGMTIKDLAELMEEKTGKKMSRQNLTQRLNRDNFQEQDMRQIAEILGCPFQLSILEESNPVVKSKKAKRVEREVTIEDLVDLEEVKANQPKVQQMEKPAEKKASTTSGVFKGFRKSGYQNSTVQEIRKTEKQQVVGDMNPYTRREYENNSVRMHPKRIGYVQVYDKSEHKWTDMTEWAFLGFQERKKKLLGKDYEPPIYLD